MKKTAFDKIVVGFVGLVIAIFTLLIVYTIHISQDSLLDNTTDALTKQCKALANTAAASYIKGEISLDDFGNCLDNTAQVMGYTIWFTDAAGKVIYNSDTTLDKNNKAASDTDINITDYIAKKQLYTLFCEKDAFNELFSHQMLSAAVPVYLNGRYMGMLLLHTDSEFLDKIGKRTFSSVLMPFLVLMLLSLFALMAITNSTLKPIREIIATSKSYAAGNFNAKINVHTKNEFGELARYMEQMADELSRSNEYRKSFISNISHDFRSPLTSIKGYIEAMLDGTIPPEMHEKYLNIVLNETKRLTKLTQGLLELNTFDSFDLQLDKSNFDIKSIITPTINTFEGRCQDKGIYLHCVIHTENTIVFADRTKIQQVIYNLVDNAIKFTPEGRQIIVQVTEKNNKIYVSVKDEGVGIPKDSLKKVFDRFYKTDPSRGKDKTGTGLGLAITKEIIKAHGETITVTSEVGEGSEFIFSLPMKKEMQIPIKLPHNTKHNEEAAYISNGKFKIKKN